ncbi:MAG TPA: sugar phosphate isomerase/epimerase family protein [Bryobacteraceae bacterium]|jgi:L-ribulose-5-phosphate 3-epimerase|nr:sugar phosphate isomerase/epimerase family protein [Bryobacteraceae bacterium]
MTRRDFMAVAALPAWASAAPAGSRLPIRKAVLFEMLPKSLSIADRFKLARDTGFEATECPTTPDQSTADEIRKASESTRLPIHSVMNMAHWKYPLSSADAAVVAESVKGIETSLRNAHFWGAETVLLVPAVVNPQTSYQDAWTRSQEQIRKLIPMAEELKVIIAVEEVWNKFLLSPLEYAKYIDDFQSPWVRSYFDVGNVVLTGYPQDWIRTVGKRIVKLHIKDFRFRKMQAEFVPLREGDIDWIEVHKALGEIGYHGTATVELEGGGESYLREVNRRFELILSGA